MLLVASLVRISFIPLILLCNFGTDSRDFVIFKNDAFPVVFVLLLGLTNGYLGTVAMIGAPM